MAELMGVVVVRFGGWSEACDLNHCPMDATWFPSREEAEPFLARQPEWTRPHVLYVTKEAEPFLARPEWTLAELVGRLSGSAYPADAVVAFDIRMTWPGGHARLAHPVPADVEEEGDDG